MINHNLDNKTVLLTGAKGFLGKHFCKILIEAKADLIISDLDQRACEDLSKQFNENEESNAVGIGCDITDENSVTSLLASAKKFSNKIDVVINCATYSSSNKLKLSAPYEDYDLEEWKRMMSVNLDGAFLLTKIFGPEIAKNKSGGSIILLSSIYGFLGTDQSIYDVINSPKERFNNPAAYSTSKGGVINLARYLATYWAKDGVRVNVLSLGGIDNHHDPKFKKEYSAKVPMQRMGQPKELDGALLFLASNESSYFTGQNLVVDGGYSAW